MHQAMVKDMCHDFIRHLNSLSANFGFCNISTNLNYSCCTIPFLWCVSLEQDKYLDEFYTTWRKGIRKRFNLPRCTHCNMAPLLVECFPIQIQIMNRMVCFMQSCIRCNNTSLNMLSHLAFHDSGSNV